MLDPPRSTRASLVLIILASILRIKFYTSAMMTSGFSPRIVSDCACGQLHLEFPVAAVTHETKASDCHCPKCRKYHTSAFVSYLSIPADRVSIVGEVETFRDTCNEVGEVERIRCRKCSSKLASRIVQTGQVLVNMGPMLDDSIPENLAAIWRFHRHQWQDQDKVSWATAFPNAEYTSAFEKRLQVSARCSCGTVEYDLDAEIPSEMQHCYCRLCRKFSGGPFMTWMPASNTDMKWTTRIQEGGFAGARRYGPPDLTRTTTHGQRHFCPSCGGAMTIVYDEQPELTWPAVGGFEDKSLPGDRQQMNDSVHRVMHICCRYQQKWYTIPQDGLPRIPEAS
jgi:hypothetical protein